MTNRTIQVAEPATQVKTAVCLIAPSLAVIGGQAVQADLLRKHLSQRPKLEVTLLPTNPRLPSIFGACQRVKYLRTVVTTIAYVGMLLRRIPRVDVLHIFSPSYWAFLLGPAPAIVLGRLFRKRVILNYHSGEAEDHLTRWKVVAIPLLRLAHQIVVPSSFLVDVFRTFGLSATPIHNFIEVEHIPFRERVPLRPQVLSNRNFEPHYNVSCVLRAFSHLQHRHPEARLTVAGGGSEREALLLLARDLGLKHVSFAGQVEPSAMANLYDEADLYFNASDVDNMPLSIIEAQAAGLPVVTTNAGGIPYLVEHEHSGLLVERNDDRGLAEAAIRLLDDPDLARHIVHTARERCRERFSWSVVAEQWEACYEGAHG